MATGNMSKSLARKALGEMKKAMVDTVASFGRSEIFVYLRSLLLLIFHTLKIFSSSQVSYIGYVFMVFLTVCDLIYFLRQNTFNCHAINCLRDYSFVIPFKWFAFK